jgi:hypothetical protein
LFTPALAICQKSEGLLVTKARLTGLLLSRDAAVVGVVASFDSQDTSAPANSAAARRKRKLRCVRGLHVHGD